MRNFFASVKLFCAFFVTLFGLAELIRGDAGERFVGAALASVGLTFFVMVVLNIRR